MNTEVLVLGGGIAGLYLAHQLWKAGKDFILLEGSNRLGGRLFTHPELNRDVGGRSIGDKYVKVMKLVEELDVPVHDITDMIGAPSAIYFDGKLYPKWDAKLPNPSRLEFSKLKNAASLESLDAWYKRPDLDEPYAEFLKKLGHTKAEIDIINLNANYNDVYNTSAINSFHSRAFRKFNGTKRLFNFTNGPKSFVDAIVRNIKQAIYTNKMVVSISDKEKMVEVKCSDGSVYRSKKVVTTLPFSTLRDVNIDGALNKNQVKAIKELPYTKITQIHLTAKAPFWEDDEMPMGMWTDTPLERIMKLDPRPEKRELVCWVNGKGTKVFDEMSDEAIKKFTLDKLKAIRPATEGKIEYVGTHNWGKYPYNKGAYAEFGIGHAALFEDMIRPAGNIHFAGEHAARNSRGIEGAAESADRVFDEIINT